jgi:hypothetical protein
MSDQPRRAGLLAAIALVGTLLVGGALGYAAGSRPRPMRLKQVALLGISRTELSDSLHLNQQQRIKVDSILDAAELQAERSIGRMMEDVRRLTRDAQDSVRAGLGKEQRALFDFLMGRLILPQPRSPLPPRGTTP